MVSSASPRPSRWFTVNEELVLAWEDGAESYIDFHTLRRSCPCAGCAGEGDLLGRVHKGPESTLTPDSFRIGRIEPVGGYALQLHWVDGHSTGLFAFEYLRRLGELE